MKRSLVVLGAFALATGACSSGDDADPTAISDAATGAGPDTTQPDATVATDDGEATGDSMTDGTTPPATEPIETTPAITAASTESTAPPTTAVPATSAAPTETSAPAVNPPEIADPATAFDWFAIVEGLLVDLDRIGREPSIALVEVACAPDSQCFEEQLNVVETLTSQGLRLEGGGVAPLVEVEFLNTINDLPIEESIGVGLRVTERVFDGPQPTLVNEAGDVVQVLEERSDLAPGESFERLWVLAREAPGEPWRVSFIEVRDP